MDTLTFIFLQGLSLLTNTMTLGTGAIILFISVSGIVSLNKVKDAGNDPSQLEMR